MYPQKRWFYNLAVVWSNYYSSMPPNMRDTSKKKDGFKKFFKNIEPNISNEELDAIPQYFVDSIEARDKTKLPNSSREDLKYLIVWIYQLDTLYNKHGEIQDVDKEVKSERFETKREKVEDTISGNVHTVTTAEFKRSIKEFYNGTTSFSDWEEVPDTRKTENTILPGLVREVYYTYHHYHNEEENKDKKPEETPKTPENTTTNPNPVEPKKEGWCPIF